MKVRTDIPLERLEQHAEEVSADYGGNVMFEFDVLRGSQRAGVLNYQVWVRALVYPGAGVRTARSGRPGPHVCWHVYRDFISCVVSEDREAVVETVGYRFFGADDYRDRGLDEGRLLAGLCQCVDGAEWGATIF